MGFQPLRLWTVMYSSFAWNTVTRFRPEVGQIGPKWDKFGNVFRSDSVHFGSVSQNVLNLI